MTHTHNLKLGLAAKYSNVQICAACAIATKGKSNHLCSTAGKKKSAKYIYATNIEFENGLPNNF